MLNLILHSKEPVNMCLLLNLLNEPSHKRKCTNRKNFQQWSICHLVVKWRYAVIVEQLLNTKFHEHYFFKLTMLLMWIVSNKCHIFSIIDSQPFCLTEYPRVNCWGIKIPLNLSSLISFIAKISFQEIVSLSLT